VLQESRAREYDHRGRSGVLDEQDARCGTRELIAEGWLWSSAHCFGRAATYALLAAIAAVHSETPTAAATDWAQIVALYDVLLRLAPSPVVELNRAVAVAMHDGPAAGLAAGDAILARGELADYHLAHAARAYLCRRLGRTEDARAAYRRALEWSGRHPSVAFSSAGLRNCRRDVPGPMSISWRAVRPRVRKPHLHPPLDGAMQ
jgi:RNA polymerase sigma-70 factor (ECF subfamily)